MAATTSAGPKSPPIASTAICPVKPEEVTIARMVYNYAMVSRGLDLDVDHLATAVGAVRRIHVMRTEGRAIGRIFSDLRSFESVGCAAVGATAFGLLAFRISHGRCGLKGE